MNRVVLLAIFMVGVASADEQSTQEKVDDHHGRAVNTRNAFSPRLDYEEWTPLGRGDPLKNDPTYDYVPPVLDRVHYWMDPSKRTPDPPLPDVVTTSTESLTTPIPATSRLGTMSLLDPLFKFMESSKASLGLSTPTTYFRPTPVPSYYYPQPPPKFHPPQSLNSADYAPPKGQPLQRPPYTILMPPPPPPSMPTTTQDSITSFGTTTKTTTTLADIVLSSEATSSTSTVSSETTIIGHSENLYKPVAITMPEIIDNDSTEVERTTIVNRPAEETITLPIVSHFEDIQNNSPHHEPLKSSEIIRQPPKKDEDHFFLPTTVRTTTTTRILTTDPMFNYYKQTNEAGKVPFFLIIQGHSKVKTYGASKNKVKPIVSNEINFEDGFKRKNYDDLEMSESSSRRRQRKLGLGLREVDADGILGKENVEVIQGVSTIELKTGYKAQGPVGFSVSDSETALEDLEEALPKSLDGESKARTKVHSLKRSKRSFGRRLLATIPTQSSTDKLDAQQLGLESLIALNDDYNSDDVINLILKEEGEGSGIGNFVSSLFGRSLKSRDEI